MKGLILFLFISCNVIIYGQADSLHLAFSIVGDSTVDPIMSCVTLGDVNGDGFSDFALTFKSYVKIYFGNNLFSLSNYKIITPIDTNKLNDIRIFRIGDMNKDGFDDFVLSAMKPVGGIALPKGIAYIYLGGKIINDIPIFQFEDSCIEGMNFTASGGDVNGDGFNDVILGVPYNWCDGRGRAFLFYGGDSISNTPNVTFESETPTGYDIFYSDDLCMNGDINGDGYNDIIVAEPNLFGEPNLTSKVYIYFGDSLVTNQPNFVLNVPHSSSKISSFILPDFNGDGINDLYITNKQRLYFGSAQFDTTNYLQFDVNFEEDGGYIGDINKDGYSDMELGDSYHLNSLGEMVGASKIYFGSSTPDTTVDYFLEGETKWGGFGSGSTLGDLNGDGYDEFYIIARGYPAYEHPLGKIYVYSMKKFIVGVKEKEVLPFTFSLEQNYPNPFNPSTTIEYQIPKSGIVKITVYNMLGQKVKTLVNTFKTAGKYQVEFNAVNLPSGIYIYKMQAGNFAEVKKMLLLK